MAASREADHAPCGPYQAHRATLQSPDPKRCGAERQNEKKSPPVLRPAGQIKHSDLWLEGEPSTDADHARTTIITVGSSLRRKAETYTEQPDVSLRQTSIFHVRVDIGEVEVIQGVGRSHAQLKIRPFTQFDVFRDRRIQPVLGGVNQRVTRCV